MAESDWDTVTVLRKKGPSAAQAKSKQAVLSAQRRGEDVETSKKCRCRRRASGPKAPSFTKPLGLLAGRGGRAGAPRRPGLFPNRRRRCSFPRRGRRAEQAALDHQEHGQAGPGDRGAAPRPGPAGGGQGDPAGPAEQRADPEGPGHENQREAPGHCRLRVRKGHPQQPGAGQDREGHRP